MNVIKMADGSFSKRGYSLALYLKRADELRKRGYQLSRLLVQSQFKSLPGYSMINVLVVFQNSLPTIPLKRGTSFHSLRDEWIPSNLMNPTYDLTEESMRVRGLHTEVSPLVG